MAKGTYWLPRGAVVKWNDIEIVLDAETNSVLVDDKDWPELQRAHFSPEDCDEPILGDDE